MQLKYSHLLPLASFSILMLIGFTTWGQENFTWKQKRKIKKANKELDFVFIQADTFIVGNDVDIIGDPVRTDLRKNKWVITGDFLISKYEVSNKNYRNFISDVLNKEGSVNSNLLPDSSVWNEPSGVFHNYPKYYSTHDYYNDYPVVGINQNMAMAYANWCTEKYNESPNRIFKKVQFRLPTEDEWYLAASGGEEYNIYPWEGIEAIDEEGMRLANYCTFREYALLNDTMWMRLGNSKDLNQNDVAMVEYLMVMPNIPFNDESISIGTMPVNSFKPNKFGIYNMGGNVEELVALSETNFDSEQKIEVVTKGGSWKDSGYETLIINRQLYEDRSVKNNEIGFRLVMIIEEY